MQQYVFIVIIAIVFLAMIIFAVIGKNYSLDKIKARKVGNGQHGTALGGTQGNFTKLFNSKI